MDSPIQAARENEEDSKSDEPPNSASDWESVSSRHSSNSSKGPTFCPHDHLSPWAQHHMAQQQARD